MVLGAGDTVGELALFANDGRRTATVAALEPTEVWSLQRETFHALRHSCVGAADFLLWTLAVDVRRLSDLLLDALYLPVEVRVLRRLVDLECLYREPGRQTEIPLTQDDAERLGVRLENGAHLLDRMAVYHREACNEADVAVAVSLHTIELADRSGRPDPQE